MKVMDKVVVVTGGGGGMGRELVLQLLARGARVAAVDRDAQALEETEKLAGARRDRLATFVLDITDRAAVRALPDKVLGRFGVVDGLINNAGIIQPFVRLEDLDDAAIERVMNVNFYGTLRMTRAFLPHLLGRPVAHLANVSSMGGFLPVPGQTLYGASKAAVKLLTEGLASELEGTPVKVTVIFPGAVGTDIAAHSGVSVDAAAMAGKKAPPMLAPSKAAELMLEGIEHDRTRVLVGRDAQFLDALVRLNPVRAARFIAKQMRSLLPS